MQTKAITKAFIDSRRARQLSAVTIKTYEWALAKMEALYPKELPQTSTDIQQIFIHNSDLSSSSLRTIWSRLRIFWAWADKEGICHNIMPEFAAPAMKPKFPRILRSSEIRHLLGFAESERDYTILAVLLDTGMRVGELSSMTRDTIGPDGVLVSGKTGDRIVPIIPKVLELLERQGGERGLWIGRYGKLTTWGLQQIVRGSMRKAGFHPPKIGPHTLRHTFGVQYIISGGDIFSLQRIMGHTNVKSTMIYVQMSTSHISEQHQKFSPMADVSIAHFD